MRGKLLQINLFGACMVRGEDFEITGTKQKALVVLLATAPFGRRTRAFLQDALWGVSCYDTGRQSLRRALADIKALMGPAFERVFILSNGEIGINMDAVAFVGTVAGGEFLEGIDIREEGFNDWLRGIRQNPAQLHTLYAPTRTTALPRLRPVVAILPFTAIGLDGVDAQLADWIPEELARSLARSNLLSVISYLSSRRLGGPSVDVSLVGDKLGAQYCLTGVIRPEAGRFCLDADFMEVATGRLLWTRRTIGTIGDYFTNSSEPLGRIVKAIGRAIADESINSTTGRPVVQLEDRHLLVAGVSLLHELRLSSFARSRELLEETVRRAPLAAEAYSWLGEWHVMSVFNGWSSDRLKDTATARDLAARALDIDPECAFAMTIDGIVHNSLMGRFDIAGKRFEQALDRNPNESMAWLASGVMHAQSDDGVEAVARAEHAMALTPLDPFLHLYESFSASSHIANDNFQRAFDLADSSFQTNDRHLSTLRARLCAAVNLGRMDEARADARLLLRRAPGFNVRDYLAHHPAASTRFGRKHADAMLSAGVPREP